MKYKQMYSKSLFGSTSKPFIVHFKPNINIDQPRCPQLRIVWLTCEGETLADKEWLGTVNYTPWQVFQDFLLSQLVF